MNVMNRLSPIVGLLAMLALPSLSHAATSVPWDVSGIPAPGFEHFEAPVTVQLKKVGATYKVTASYSGDFVFQANSNTAYTVKDGTFNLTADLTRSMGLTSGQISVTGYIPTWVPEQTGDTANTTVQNLFSANLKTFGFDAVGTDGTPRALAFKTDGSSFDGWAKQFNPLQFDESIYLSGLPISQFLTQFSSTAPIVRVIYRDALAVATVPVPAAVWLFGSALAALVGFRRNSR